MLEKIRRAVIPGLITVVAGYGISFAATGSVNPMNLVSSEGSVEAPETSPPSHTPNSHAADGQAHKAAKTPKPDRTPKPSHGPERSTEGCPEGFTGNHGEFVSQSDDKEAAAQSNCGKPVQAVHTPKPSAEGDDEVKTEENEEAENETEPAESPETDHTGGGSDKGAEHSNGHGPSD